MSADYRSHLGAVDLDDVDGLTAADRDGLLRAASMAGAQMRSTAAALHEGALDGLKSELPPRTVSWVATRAPADTAGALLASALGGSMSAPFVAAAEVPPWIGALDVLIAAGDDPADPALIAAVATGVRRGARVLVVAPEEGPLREVAGSRAVLLGPRVWVPGEFSATRYLAAGLAALRVVDPAMQVDLAAIADDLDAEALRNSAARETFTNPAKALAERMLGREIVLAGDHPATMALARHAAATMLRVGQHVTGVAPLSDVLIAIGSGFGSTSVDYETALFHDSEFDGPLPVRMRAIVSTIGDERPTLAARLSGFDDVDVISADDVPDVATPTSGGRPEQQLALLLLRWEMAAVYTRLARG